MRSNPMAKKGLPAPNIILKEIPPNPPDYFYQRFDLGGGILNPDWPRITTGESVQGFGGTQRIESKPLVGVKLPLKTLAGQMT